MRIFLKNGLISCGVAIAVVLSCELCFAFDVAVSFPDGTPAVGATVTYTDENGNKQAANCDVNGHCQFSQTPGNAAQIRIQPPDGKNYASVVLPATVFGSGETAIVLQSK